MNVLERKKLSSRSFRVSDFIVRLRRTYVLNKMSIELASDK